jgi:hypothetical protein
LGYRQSAIGDGPARAVLRAGVLSLVQKSRLFGLRGDYYHPLLMPVSSSSRKGKFWVAGFWTAVHILNLGVTPFPITPWWFYAIAGGKDNLPVDLDYIRVLDAESAADLEPWFKFTAEDILRPNDHTSPVGQLLINHLNFHDVCVSTQVPCMALIVL